MGLEVKGRWHVIDILLTAALAVAGPIPAIALPFTTSIAVAAMVFFCGWWKSLVRSLAVQSCWAPSTLPLCPPAAARCATFAAAASAWFSRSR